MNVYGLVVRMARLAGKQRSVNQLQRWAASTRRWSYIAHRNLFNVMWQVAPIPEWHDHNLDIHYQWPETRNPFGFERGCFSRLAFREGGRRLDLCCGDGFNTRAFFSFGAEAVTAVDFDPDVIAHARRYNPAPNVDFRVADVRTEFPQGKFDNIVWDAAIEHFTPAEIEALVQKIKAGLTETGILTGYTIGKPAVGKLLVHHEYEFESKEDLLRFFTPHFARVRVFETQIPERTNYYFWASDGPLPFDTEWSASISAVRAPASEIGVSG